LADGWVDGGIEGRGADLGFNTIHRMEGTPTMIPL